MPESRLATIVSPLAFPNVRADSASPSASGSSPEPRCLRSPCGASPPGPSPSPPPSRRSSACRVGCRAAASSARPSRRLRPRPFGVRRLVHARRLDRRPRRQMLQPRKLVLGPLMLDPKLAKRYAQLLVLQAKPRHFLDQVAHNPDQIRLGKKLKRIRDARRHPKLESHFVGSDSPLRPAICPGYPFSD